MTVHSSQVQSFQYTQEYLRHQKRLQMDFFQPVSGRVPVISVREMLSLPILLGRS